MTFLQYNPNRTIVIDSEFAEKENNITKLQDLMRLKHPQISLYRHIFVEKQTITLVSDYIEAPRLFSCIC